MFGIIRRLQIAKVHRKLRVERGRWNDHRELKHSSRQTVRPDSYSSFQRRLRNAVYQYDEVLDTLPMDRLYLVEVVMPTSRSNKCGMVGSIAVYDHTHLGEDVKMPKGVAKWRDGTFHFLLKDGKLTAIHNHGDIDRALSKPVTTYWFSPKCV